MGEKCPTGNLLGLEANLDPFVLESDIQAYRSRRLSVGKKEIEAILTRLFFWIVLKIDNDVLERVQITNGIAK